VQNAGHISLYAPAPFKLCDQRYVQTLCTFQKAATPSSDHTFAMAEGKEGAKVTLERATGSML
jgi:hypothetical protein